MQTNIPKKFSKNYTSIRKFLRIISCGCYHRKQFGKWNIMPRNYDELLRQLRFIIPENRLKLARHGRYSYTVFCGGDTYHGSFNFLQSSYLVKTLLPTSTLHMVCILQLLSKSDRPLGIEEITDALDAPLASFDPASPENSDLVQLSRRRCQSLEAQGILRRIKTGQKNTYIISPSLLSGLSDPEAEELLAAVAFYRNVALLSIPGYFLDTAIRELYPPANIPEGIFQFKNNHLIRILDDEILFQILEIIHKDGLAELDRENGKPVCISIKNLETDYIYNRQYICGVDTQGQDIMIRADQIEAARPKSSAGKNPVRGKRNHPSSGEIRLKVHFTDETERAHHFSILKNTFPEGTIIEDNSGEAFFIAPVADPLHAYPWLWPLQPWAEIISPVSLRNRMKQAAREALAFYGNAF